MGKKRYNWRARQVVNTEIDNASTKKIEIDQDLNKGSHDASNALVLPSEKRTTKVKKDKVTFTRVLSKSHRKKLEKIVDKKKKKENRQNLLDALAKVQATSEELNNLVSIASIQTKGLKRHFHEQQFPEKVAGKKLPKCDADLLNGEAKINAIRGTKRMRRALTQEEAAINDPNVVGFEESESEDDEENSPVEESDLKEEKREVELNKKEIIQKDIKWGEDAPKPKKLEVEQICPLPKAERKKATFVQVLRDEDIQIARLKLPILAEEQQIMETIAEHSVVIIAGETGSGKTTQVPQFLYEAGYALRGQIIGITEPRRVAAVSMARRVGEEMSSKDEVGYLMRFEGNVTDRTKIKFMTDGVLLKEVQNDFLLKRYSAIVVDEAHERSVYTDILVGLLSRIVPLRLKRGDPLKLIIMSATLRVEDFTLNARLFPTAPPVVNVAARQFPVTVHFNKRTKANYLKEAYGKACKVHCRLPDGGMLLFVTGQREVRLLARKLRAAFPVRNKERLIDAAKDFDRKTRGKLVPNFDGAKTGARRFNRKVKVLPKVDLDDYGMPEERDDDPDDSLGEDDEDDPLGLDDDDDEALPSSDQPLWVLPLYALLESRKQQRVFEPPPPGCRLCVVATNVAETSLTIPGVKYVIDTGKTKAKLYDKATGVTSYVVDWTNRASADQRAGRAGRTGPGHCYRLYSSAVFNDVFRPFAAPEICAKPVDDLYLQMKCMNIDRVANFPFPTTPDAVQLRAAADRLTMLGALRDGGVTPLGRAVARFPVLPRYGKMLALSHQHDLLPYTVLLVAALAVQEVLLEAPAGEAAAAVGRRWRWAGVAGGGARLLGDPMVLLTAVGAAEYAHQRGELERFCVEHGLRHKAIAEIRKLRRQLTDAIRTNVPDCALCVDPNLRPPTAVQARLLRQIILAGMGDQVARKIPPDDVKDDQDKVRFKHAYRAINLEEPVWLHHGCVLKKDLPEFVVYQEIYETNRMYMRGVTAIDPEWLVRFVPHLCNLSEPLSHPEPSYNPSTGFVNCTVRGSFGSQNWELPNCLIDYEHVLGAYKWFARFLLEGKVFPKLEKYAKSLLSVPSAMIKTWTNLQKRSDSLLKALSRAGISSRDELADAWEKEPKYLLKEYLFWLPESAHGEVTLLWPPLQNSCQAH